jgi:excisionase family DNA binding protein
MSETNQFEAFVDVVEAGRFLGLSASHVRRLVESGRIRGHNYGVGKRKFWRFRLSELAIPVSSDASSVPRNQE